MKRTATVFSTVALLALLAAPARAEGIGVGAVFTLTGVDGMSVTYDTEKFHVDGLFGLFDQGAAEFALGGRFFYAVDTRAGADLSLGGGLTLVNGDDDVDFHFEAGAKIRVFIVPNVAFHTTIGLGLVLDDEEDGDDALLISGQPLAAFGITYFFD